MLVLQVGSVGVILNVPGPFDVKAVCPQQAAIAGALACARSVWTKVFVLPGCDTPASSCGLEPRGRCSTCDTAFEPPSRASV